MTVREALNFAYYHVISDMREEDRLARMAGHKFDQTLNERIIFFEEKIGLRPDHEELALWMHRHVLLPARGLSEEEIADMFEEGADSTLPAGIGEEHRWRYQDQEWDGLSDFEGNPWDLPGMNEERRREAERLQEEADETNRDTLG
jgi:hypothetical protein